MATVDFEQATRVYQAGHRPAVDALDLRIADGEFVVLVGPSGCGKSTTLRMLAGLEPIDSGSVFIGDTDVTMLPPRDRDIAMVFQNYALYPHMTVGENIGFHLKIKRMPKAEIASASRDAARLLDLEAFLDRKPAKLSGGQRQRVAMGRAIVRQPQVFLMDEPLSNLDAKLRVQTRDADRRAATTPRCHHGLCHARSGRSDDDGRPRRRLERRHPAAVRRRREISSPRPLNLFVAGFIGSPSMNFLPAQLDEGGARFGDLLLPVTPEQRASATSADVTIGIRPEALRVATSGGLPA